ncbi:8-amino-7-oxononanoate synthase [Flavobacterium album]|uniref:8-amino-7-oxononanoate synthase n=1 Tax=Flavobacterium album TaxID=2175091 RepID=A0A2S1QWC1_9FLAO|nr:8-amino-7-oxononanoate synthase [Flavobacterium album]AWH84629.1 8-amino-7-oxononanoate synthase [Flavobacterium album]
MEKLPGSLQVKLNEREQANALRKLSAEKWASDFSSNDYLGFSANREIFDSAHNYLLEHGFTQNGSTGSRLISGNHRLYTITEDHIAQFHNAASALIFNSGYDANVGFFSSVPQKGDIVLYDEYIHASIRDGLRLSNARVYKFPHNDLAILEKQVQKFRLNDLKGEVYIVTESVFSMDGDSPDLNRLVALAIANNCRLVIDEAHALGVFGEKGEGLIQHLGLEDKVFTRIVTFGKALGCHGAAVLGSPQLKEYLVNFARSLIYTTALPPHSLATILIAYKTLETTPERNRLTDIISFFRSEVNRLQLQSHFIESASAIHCAVISGNEMVKNVASVLQENGFGVKAILSPTVPQGAERLRICLHSYTTEAEITGMLELLSKCLN